MKFHYQTLITVLGKLPDFRAEYECQELTSWFKTKSILFQGLKQEIVADVIRHCEFERKHKDDVLIKQGDSGDRLYIILKGSVSIYVIHDNKDNPREVLQQVEDVCGKNDLDRFQLGQYVWSGGEGKSFGEVALLKEDCIRTATVVADTDTDLVVIDRDLYNRSVRDVLEREYSMKTKFVEDNLLFKQWPMKQKRLLVVALKKETAKYGSYLIRQGSSAENVFFLLSGEIEITCDPSQFKTQYEDQWRDMETLLPGLLPRSYGQSETPHEMLKRKKTQHKLIQMCLLGSNEIVGALDVIIGLPTSLDNAMVTREAEVLLLSRCNYERLFSRKYAQTTAQTLRERLTMRLYMYIHRSDTLHTAIKSSFFKYLTFLLKDQNAVMELRKQKRRDREEKTGLIKKKEDDDIDTKYGPKEAERMSGMLKMLDMNPKTVQVRLPTVESGQKVINEIEAGLNAWIERSKGGGSGNSSPASASPRIERKAINGSQRRNSLHGGDFLRTPTVSRNRSLTRTPSD